MKVISSINESFLCINKVSSLVVPPTSSLFFKDSLEVGNTAIFLL